MSEVMGKISRCEATIAIVGAAPTDSKRMAQTLMDKGFPKVTSLRDLPSLTSAIESNKAFDWVFICFSQSWKKRINPILFLEFLEKSGNLDKIRTSFILNPSDSPCLKAAFERGLFSWHPWDFNTTSMSEEWDEMASAIKLHEEDETLVAAQYLRKFLKNQREFRELLNLETSLQKFYPDHHRQRLALANAHYLSGSPDTAKDILEELNLLNADFANEVNDLLVLCEDKSPEDLSFARKNGFNKTIIIEKESFSAQLIKKAVTELGFNSVETFTDGSSAWSHMEKKPRVDLIVMNWSLEGVSALQLLQRIRNICQTAPSIVVVGTGFNNDEAQLIREMTVTRVMNQPLRYKQVLMTLAWAMKQKVQPTEIKTFEARIERALDDGDLKTASEFNIRYQKMSQASEARKSYMEAMIRYHQKDYEGASKLLREAAKTSRGTNINILNLLSKCLFRLNDYQAAGKILEKISSLSPQNLQRLCQLAKVQVTLGEEDKANDKIKQAEAIDSENNELVATKAEIAVYKGDTKEASKLMSRLSSNDNIVRHLNNLAVFKIKSGDREHALRLYQDTLESIPEDRIELHSIVSYNLALAYIKGNDRKEGLKYLEKIKDMGPSPISPKAQSLLNRLKQTKRYKNASEILVAGDKSASIQSDIEIEDEEKFTCLHKVYKPKTITSYSKALLGAS